MISSLFVSTSPRATPPPFSFTGLFPTVATRCLPTSPPPLPAPASVRLRRSIAPVSRRRLPPAVSGRRRPSHSQRPIAVDRARSRSRGAHASERTRGHPPAAPSFAIRGVVALRFSPRDRAPSPSTGSRGLRHHRAGRTEFAFLHFSDCRTSRWIGVSRFCCFPGTRSSFNSASPALIGSLVR